MQVLLVRGLRPLVPSAESHYTRGCDLDNLFNLKFMKIKCFVGVEYLIEELVFN